MTAEDENPVEFKRGKSVVFRALYKRLRREGNVLVKRDIIELEKEVK